MKTRRIFHTGCALFISFVTIITVSAGFPAKGFAQTELRLLIDPEPENHRIPLDSPLKEIWIESRVSDINGTFEWQLDGPGEFTTLAGGIGGIYRIPDQIDGEIADVMVTVQFTNQQQESVQEHLTFQLLAPEPTPTPVPTVTPIPTPTPVPTVTPVPPPTPVPLRIRHALLEQTKFFLTPGEEVNIMLDIAHTPGRKLTITCEAIKGRVECSEIDDADMPLLRAARYTAPKSSGKDMVEVEVLDPVNDETDRTLIKIEVNEQ